jgi:IMP dehydrogenase/GMP reductase
MSTKSAQKVIGNGKLKTEEGTTKKLIATGPISKWVKEFEDALRSTMSYTNSKNLKEFKGQIEFNFITETSYNRLIK